VGLNVAPTDEGNFKASPGHKLCDEAKYRRFYYKLQRK